MRNIEIIPRKAKKELSDKTIEDFVGPEYSEEESKALLDKIIRKIMEKEKEMTADFFQENIYPRLRPEKKQELAQWEDGFVNNLVARYLVFKELPEEEKKFVLSQADKNQALKNLVSFYNEAVKYFKDSEAEEKES